MSVSNILKAVMLGLALWSPCTTTSAATVPTVAQDTNTDVETIHPQPRVAPIVALLGMAAENIVSCMSSQTCTDNVKSMFGAGDDSVPLNQVKPVQCRIDTTLSTWPFPYRFVNLRAGPCSDKAVLAKLHTGDMVQVRFHPETRAEGCGYRYQRVVYTNPAGKQIVGWLNPGGLQC